MSLSRRSLLSLFGAAGASAASGMSASDAVKALSGSGVEAFAATGNGKAISRQSQMRYNAWRSAHLSETIQRPRHPHGSASPATARPGECVAAQAGATISGALSSSLRVVASPDATTHGTAVRATNTECAGVRAHICLGLTAPASLDAPISDAGDLFEQTVIARIERLILLTDAHKARRRHASTQSIMRRLRDVTARLAGAGV